jgi:hypothetical protein
MVIKRRPTNNKKKKQQNLCLDRAYYSVEIEREVVKRRYIPISVVEVRKRRSMEKRRKEDDGSWNVHSWHNRFRKLLTRYEKKSEENYLGLVQFACCLIIYRRILLG